LQYILKVTGSHGIQASKRTTKSNTWSTTTTTIAYHGETTTQGHVTTNSQGNSRYSQPRSYMAAIIQLVPKLKKVQHNISRQVNLAIKSPLATIDYSKWSDQTIRINRTDQRYVSNVSIIFDAPCLFIHHLLCVLLHFIVFLCISRTNLLMRRHSASSLFSAIFVFEKSYT
jgi:hypothetical protein